jgi:hypothetical protein
MSGFPAAEAACRAEVRAVCALVVGLKESTNCLRSILERGVVKMLVLMFNAVKIESVPLNFDQS